MIQLTKKRGQLDLDHITRNPEKISNFRLIKNLNSPNIKIAPTGQTKKVLNPLPISVLRLSEKENADLLRLGIRLIKDLEILPRGSIESRFGLMF